MKRTISLNKGLRAPAAKQLVCVLLACASLEAITARAQDATWTGAAGGDWSIGANWVPAIFPTGIATFDNTAVSTAVFFTAPTTTIGAMQFNSAASSYVFSFGFGGGVFSINQSGILGSSADPTINLDGFASPRLVLFSQSSVAGSAIINNDSSLVRFSNQSSAQNSTVTNNVARLEFRDSSTAGNSTIINTGGGPASSGTDFFDTSTAGGATITNSGPTPQGNGVTRFRNVSNAGTATINNQNNGHTVFFDSSSAGSANIAIEPGGTTSFFNNSTAGSVTINNQRGLVLFAANSSAQNADIVNNTALLFFQNSSTAGNATILNSGFGLTSNGITFFDTSTAGSASIRNSDASTFFRNSSTAGTATIDSAIGAVEFFDSSTAGNANIIVGAFHGVANFWDNSTAGFATITTKELGRTTFFGRSTGGQARLIAETGGVFDFNPGTGPNNDRRIPVGSIEGAGMFQLGANELIVGSNNFSTTVSGVITDCCGPGGSLVKNGTGTLTLAGVNNYVGATTVSEGTLLVNGSITSATTVASGAILGGTGTIAGNVTNGGILTPGSVTSVGTLTIRGNLTQNSTSTLLINAIPTQASKVLITGTAILSGAVNVNAGSDSYASSTRYTILTANDGLTGKFSDVTTNLAFLIPSLSYDANDAFLTLSCITCGPGSSGYTSVAQTGNQLAVASALNSIVESGSASESMQTVLTTLNNLTADQARAAFDSIGGASLRVISNGQIGFISGFNNVITGRLGAPAEDGTIASPGFTTGAVQLAAQDLLSDANPVYAQAGYSGITSPRDARRGVWMRVYGTNNDASGDGNANGYRVRGTGLILGADGELNEHWRVGAAIGIGRQNLSVDTSGDSGKIEATAISVYSQYTGGLWTVKAIAAYARNNNHSARNVVVGPAASVATAEFHSNSQSAYAEASYRINRGTFELQPIAALSYVRLANPDFTESGASALNLAVASQTRESIRSYIGAKTVHTFDAANGTLRLEPRLLWSHEFGDADTAPISAQITGGTGAGSFQVQGVQVKRDGAVLGLGLSGQPQKNLALLGDVSAELRSGQQSFALFAGMRYVW